MDALAVIGLVSNIISFVDFGSKLLSKAREIAHSADGALSANLDLELVAEDLRCLSDDICDGSSRPGVRSPSDQKLEDLRRGCVDVADQLIDFLDRLKIKQDKTPFKSFQRAIKIAWKKSMLEELTQRLSTFRQQLDTHFLVDLRLKVDRLALQNSEHYRKLNQRNQLIFDTILGNNKTVSDVAELQNERLNSLRSTLLLRIDEQHNTTRFQIDAATSSVQAHTTDEHERTRSRIRNIQEQNVCLRMELNEQIQTVVSEARRNAIGTSSTLHETREVLLENFAALDRKLNNLESIAKAAYIQPQIDLETETLSQTTPYILIRPDNATPCVIDSATIESIVNGLIKQQLPAAMADSLKPALKEGCLEVVAEIRSSMIVSQQPLSLNSRPSPSFDRKETGHSRRQIQRSNFHGSSSRKFQDASNSSKNYNRNSKRSKRPRPPKPKMKLQWQKRFQTPWGSVIIRSDLVIKGQSSFVRFNFVLIPNPLFSRTILWSAFEKQHGSYRVTKSMRTFNLRPDDAPIWDVCGRYGDARTLRHMLLMGEASPFDITKKGITPLHCAIYNDRYDLCEILLTNGAAVDVDWGSVSTPLSQYHYIDAFRNPKILRLLLQNRACPFQLDSEGRDFWIPVENQRALTTEELQILVPYRGINERNDPEDNPWGDALYFAISNVYIGSYSGTLTVSMIDGLVELGAKFFHESTWGNFKMNVHHLVLAGFTKLTVEIYTERAVMVSVLAKLLQLYPDKHAWGPRSNDGAWYTTTDWASYWNMLDIWYDALKVNGEDIPEFLRIDNELIQARGGGPDDLSYYPAPYHCCYSFDGTDDSDDENYSNSYDSGGNDWSEQEASDPFDIFGAALRSQWGEDVYDYASLPLLFWVTWFSLPHTIANDANDDIFGASLRSEWSEDVEVDWTPLLVLFWGSWNFTACYIICQRSG